jgi:hypothetical protein
MGDEADIGLVDTHAEGDCRDDDDAFLAQEAVLVPNPRFGRQTRVIWQRRAPPLSQPGCGVLDRAPRQAVNNAGVFRMLVTEKAQQIVARILLRLRRKMPQYLSTILSCWTRASAERFFRLHHGSDAAAVPDFVERLKIGPASGAAVIRARPAEGGPGRRSAQSC